MPKPTSPQPPGLTDEECDRMRDSIEIPFDKDDGIVCQLRDRDHRLIHAAFAAGCEAQRKVDAEITRGFVRPMHIVDTGVIWSNAAAEQIAAIESSSGERAETQPAEHCPQCGSPERGYTPYPCDNVPYARRHPWHSQPTTGEADNPVDDPSIPIEEIRGD